jgi:hypothetical protein
LDAGLPTPTVPRPSRPSSVRTRTTTFETTPGVGVGRPDVCRDPSSRKTSDGVVTHSSSGR